MTDDPQWYRDGVIYELPVRAFFDSNADGVGDLPGLIRKLDYLLDLGVTAIWLLPFYPSPLKDDGYDISDYRSIHPQLGGLRDFRRFLSEAHARGLRVLTELVLNHTSDQHAWFQRARRSAPGSARRDYYVWSDRPDRYREARIIFRDFESSNWAYDAVAQSYFWHRFYSHQPDLNFDNPEGRRELLDVVDFWMGMGVDGMRLDAVPYLFERDGTTCENLPETYAFLSELRAHVDARFEDRMLLAEANQWPEDAVAYFGDGDRCHMAFHFPLMPRMFMATRMEDRFPILDILAQTPPIPESCQWATFLRNHDELTLEMVTDEERDYMYRVYAHDPQARINLGIRHRLSPLLGKNRRLIELMNGLLFSLPGTPVVYYGDEIGMGDNIYLGDRDGVRTPMQWSADRNAGFSEANPQKLYLPVIIDPDYSPAAVNVEVQQGNPNSLLWWTKRLITTRKRFRAFGRGSLQLLYPENRRVLAFLRRYDEERILVVANLSRFAQYVELDLSEFNGLVPRELFGETEFPRIGELPYLLTLGPHAFYWFSLEPSRERISLEGVDLPTLELTAGWEAILEGSARESLEALLPQYVASRRWFSGKSRRMKAAAVVDAVSLPPAGAPARADGSEPAGILAVVRIDYWEGESETYLVPLATLPDARPGVPVIARLLTRDGERYLVEGTWDPAYGRALLDAAARRRRLRGEHGLMIGTRTARTPLRADSLADLPEPHVHQGEQSNTSVMFGDRLVLKLYRRVEEGVNPDLEVGRFLTDRTAFDRMPPLVGALEYQARRGQPMTLAMIHEYVRNEGDAWQRALRWIDRYAEGAAAELAAGTEPPAPPKADLFELADAEVPDIMLRTAGESLEWAARLGTRTGELHLALASELSDPSFAPEPFTALSQRSMYQSMRVLTGRVFAQVRSSGSRHVAEVAEVLDRESDVLARFRSLLDVKLQATAIRCHGDYHLGQVLATEGEDFTVIDFEGEPMQPISQRRIKRTAFTDVAGMLRSFDYAAMHATAHRPEPLAEVDDETADAWMRAWSRWGSAAFVRAYIATTEASSFVPPDRRGREVLLDVCLLAKAVYELGYEAAARPDWVRVPARGILDLLGAPS